MLRAWKGLTDEAANTRIRPGWGIAETRALPTFLSAGSGRADSDRKHSPDQATFLSRSQNRSLPTCRSAGSGRAGSGSSGPMSLKLGGIGRSHSIAKSAMHSVIVSRRRSLGRFTSTPNRSLHAPHQHHLSVTHQHDSQLTPQPSVIGIVFLPVPQQRPVLLQYPLQQPASKANDRAAGMCYFSQRPLSCKGLLEGKQQQGMKMTGCARTGTHKKPWISGRTIV